MGIAFENHVHAFKRTVPLRNMQPHPNGTIYLGDGRAGLHGLGVPEDPELISRIHEPRLQVESLARDHVWNILVSRDEVNAHAHDPLGTVFDEFRHAVIAVSSREVPSRETMVEL